MRRPGPNQPPIICPYYQAPLLLIGNEVTFNKEVWPTDCLLGQQVVVQARRAARKEQLKMYQL